MVKRLDFDGKVKCSSFSTPGGAQEYCLSFTNNGSGSPGRAIAEICDKYLAVAKQLDLSEETVVFSRLHVSDIANQKKLFMESELFRHIGHGVVSMVGQTPLSPDYLVLFSYHLKKEKRGFRKEFLDSGNQPWHTGVVVGGDNYSMVWSSNLAKEGVLDAKVQTELVLKSFGDFLSRSNLRLQSNLVRTWIYVRDIDNHYSGMVQARREFFNAQGLGGASRFAASTGIEGKGVGVGAIVTMDSLSFGNISEEQIVSMDALEHLPHAMRYGVTFERGLKIRFGDRAHLMISGTASIDKDGGTMHECHIEKQAQRTVDNVEALLRAQGASLSGLAYALCYFRNPRDYEVVKELLSERLGANTPLIAVEAAVCRPEWLFEMEGVGIIAEAGPFASFL